MISMWSPSLPADSWARVFHLGRSATMFARFVLRPRDGRPARRSKGGRIAVRKRVDEMMEAIDEAIRDLIAANPWIVDAPTGVACEGRCEREFNPADLRQRDVDGVQMMLCRDCYCPGCKSVVDESVCHCGGGPDDPEHGSGRVEDYTHRFVPMGCRCGYMDFGDVMANLACD